MRTLKRNKTTLYYALHTGRAEMVDANGDYTGNYVDTYGSPVLLRANISASRGSVSEEMFGLDTQYTKTVVVDKSCPIKEDTILWIGITPDAMGESGTVKHNYTVTAIAESLNSITIAIKEVEGA